VRLRDPALVDAIGPGVVLPHMLELAGDITAVAATWRGSAAITGAVVRCQGTDAEQRRSRRFRRSTYGRPPGSRPDPTRGWRASVRAVRGLDETQPGGLTTREVEVLGLIGQDMRNREIAQRCTWPEDGHHHVGAILAKLGVSSRGQAVRAAARLGIVTDSAD
jgi:DNA-binding CsgD family transcriptional regulator